MSARRKHATPRVTVLDVRLGGDTIGTLTHLPGELTHFAFTDEYIEDPRRPILSLSFKSAMGGLVTRHRPARVKLPPFFSNLLPEGHLREYLAGRGNVHPDREFFLLWLLGQDLPGAVVVRPTAGAALPPTASAEPRSAATAGELLRFSLAGLQLKFSALMEMDGGLTVPAHGVGGAWIVKLPSARYAAVPENEYVMLELARAVSIEVPEVRLVPTDRIAGLPRGLPATFGPALAVRRFDRGPGGRRIHIEDFAQVFGVYPHRKYARASYQDIARVLWAETGEAGIAEFTRRLAFSALIGNGDMHLKNWSLRYPDGRTAELVPAYDFVATVAYLPDATMALSLAGTKAMTDVTADRFARFAARAALPVRLVVDTALETAERLRAAWRKSEVVKTLPRELRSRVAAHIKAVPLR